MSLRFVPPPSPLPIPPSKKNSTLCPVPSGGYPECLGCVPMGAALALAACPYLGSMPMGGCCCLGLGCVPWGGCLGLGSMPCPRLRALALAAWHGLGSMPWGAACLGLGLGCVPWGAACLGLGCVPWPWLRALALAACLGGLHALALAALALAACHGLGSMPWGAACLGLGCVPWGAAALGLGCVPWPWQHALAACRMGRSGAALALALAACLGLGCVPWPLAACLGPWLRAMALAACHGLGRMPWPWRRAMGGSPWPWQHACHGLGRVPWPWPWLLPCPQILSDFPKNEGFLEKEVIFPQKRQALGMAGCLGACPHARHAASSRTPAKLARAFSPFCVPKFSP